MDAVSLTVAVAERDRALSPTSLSADRPCLGDVVVTDEQAVPACFTLHQIPGEPQVRCSSGTEAIGFARGFAQQHGVGAWLSSGGSMSRLVRRRREMPHDGRA